MDGDFKKHNDLLKELIDYLNAGGYMVYSIENNTPCYKNYVCFDVKVAFDIKS
jgi:hypothetical protein